MTADGPFTLGDLEAQSYEENAAFQWMVCSQRIHDDMAGREGCRMVIYEELCQELESTTRQLFDFAGLSCEVQSQRFVRHLESSEAHDASYFGVVRPPLAALDKWRDRLSSEQITRIERIVCHAEFGRSFLNAT